MNRSLYLFIHIEKAAGTTFHNILKKKLSEYYILKPYPKHGKHLYPEQLKDIFKHAPFVNGLGGHRLKPFLEYEKYIDREIKYLTILRDPVERYLSHYNHHVTKGIGDYKLQEFLEKEYFHNFQTKKIAGEASFEKAKNIIKKFHFVDVVKSLELGLRKNKGDYVVEKEKLNSADLDKIHEANKEDLKLYKYVTDNRIGSLNKYVSTSEKRKGTKTFNTLKEKYLQYIVQNIAYLKNSSKIKSVKRGY